MFPVVELRKAILKTKNERETILQLPLQLKEDERNE
jgi:hypothetical protein